jgi:SAM-dependent MidA family methyltransferase
MSLLPASIREAIQKDGGAVTFARFMELALTDPEAGYYTGAEIKVGAEGDFTTAPRRVPEFNRAVARLVAGLVDSLRESGAGEVVNVVEIGAGEGDLAAGLLETWAEERPDLRSSVAYRLIEVGPALRARQEERLRPLGSLWDIAWLSSLPAGVGSTGVVVTNELIDALPVHRVRPLQEGLSEAWVRLIRESGAELLVERWGPLSDEAAVEVRRLFGEPEPASLAKLTRDGEIELRPAARALLEEAATAFASSCVVTIDYGDWLAGPSAGTPAPPAGAAPVPHGRSIRAYYRHQRRADLYDAVGRQDLTADVDFRALALHGGQLGFESVLFIPVAALLAGLGGPEPGTPPHLGTGEYSLESDAQESLLAALLSPDDLGGLFKVMVQVREE